MENVKALVSKKFIDEFKVWCDYLADLGYKNFYQVLNAKIMAFLRIGNAFF